MSEEELARLEELATRVGDEVARNGPYANVELIDMRDILGGIPALIAEIRRLRAIEAAGQTLMEEWAETPGYTYWPLSTGLTRLRAILAPLVARAPTLEGGDGRRICGYCYVLDEHHWDCPWQLAREALAEREG